MQQTIEITPEMAWIWLQKGKMKRERKSLSTATQNNAVRINYIKVKIDNMKKCSNIW